MKINSINNVSFKRTIPVTTSTFYETSGRELDKKTIEIAKVLNSKKTSSYTQESALNIRNFFKSVLGDYNGQNGVEFRKLPKEDTLVLLSGKDLNAIKQLEEKQKPIKKDVNKSKTLSNRRKKQVIDELHSQVDGVKGKPKSYLSFRTDYSNNKVDSIKYCMKQLFYSPMVDGIVDRTKPTTYHPTTVNKAQNFIYEENTIDCLA